MHKLLYCILISLFTAKGYGQDSLAIARENFNKLSILQGTWDRANDKPGRTTIETWQAAGKYAMTGAGITLKGKDTAFIEKLSLEIKGHYIYYIADVPGNANKVYFKLTQWTGDTFTFEDPAHDFPQKIVYQIMENKVKAVISGGGRFVEYQFQRRK